MLQSYLINQRTLIIPFFVAVVILINSITPQDPMIPLKFQGIGILLLIFWLILRGWVEQKFIFINNYYLLMKRIEEHTGTLVLKLLEHPPKHLEYFLYWKQYFEIKQREVTRKFNQLNEKLFTGINNSRYCLINVNLTLIETEFIEIFRNIDILNKDFKDMILCENIPEYKYSWIDIENKYKKAIVSLDKSEFSEIMDTVKDFLVFPHILEDIDNHNSHLIKMLQDWQNHLPKILPTEVIEYPNRLYKNEYDISFIEQIETLLFFRNGDIFYHCTSLKSFWNNFKRNSNDYKKEKKTLFDLIQVNIFQKLEAQDVKILTDSDGFYISIFKECIIEAKGEKSGYVYHRGNIQDTGDYQIYYCKPFDDGSPNYLSVNSHVLAITNEPTKIITIHKELRKEITAQHIDQSIKLIEIENKLRKAEDDLKEALKTVWPTRMDCFVIKEGK